MQEKEEGQALLASLIGGTESSYLRPREFFVAYHGVITLAFYGFPPPLVNLKNQIATVSVFLFFPPISLLFLFFFTFLFSF